MRGLPKYVTIFDVNNNPLQKQEFVYHTGATLSTVWNMAVEAYRTVPGDYGFYVGDYMLRSQHVYLEMKHKYIYDQTDFSKFNKETMVYYYHNTHKTFPAYIDLNYLWHSRRITFKYPFDLTGAGSEPGGTNELAGGIWALRNWHVITPVERLEYRMDEATLGFKLIGGEFSAFRKNVANTRPLLKGKYRLNRASAEAGFTPLAFSGGGTVLTPDGAYQLMESYTYDDASAGNDVNVTGVTNSKGVTRNYEYGYNNVLVTADHISLGSTQFRNEYSYNTIDGLLSEKDANDQITTYEYDNFGRLKLIRDNGGNVRTRYRYNTKNISEFNAGLGASASAAGIGQAITFTSLLKGETAGVTKYVWDFGDGQIMEEATGATSHSYTLPGTYTVKLAKVNPEYGTVMATQQVIVYPPLSVSMSTCGIRDLCDHNSQCPVSASVFGGCPGASYTYSWYYRQGSGSWVQFDSTTQPSAYFPVEIEGLYQLKCIVANNCQNSAESVPQDVTLMRSGICPP
jgi:YD repeat-containing protein